MSESLNNSIITGPGKGVISDGFGVAWAIADSGAVLIAGQPDSDTQPVTQIAFIDGFVWRQHANNLRWSCKRHRDDPWSPPTHVSPLPGPAATDSAIADAFAQGTGSILAAVAALRSDFDTWKATQPPAPTPTQIMQALTSFRADLDSREDALSGQVSVVAGLCAQIIAQQGLTGNIDTGYQTTLVALLDQILGGQISATNVATSAAAAALSNHNVLVAQLNAIQAVAASRQLTLVALLRQVVDTATGPNGLVPIKEAIGVLQQDFTNLTQTLNAIAIGISAKLQEILLLDDPAANAAMIATIVTTKADVVEVQQDVDTILLDVQQILSLVKPQPATRLVADLDSATHEPQAIPPRG